jgi:hypothetical protein
VDFQRLRNGGHITKKILINIVSGDEKGKSAGLNKHEPRRDEIIKDTKPIIMREQDCIMREDMARMADLVQRIGKNSNEFMITPAFVVVVKSLKLP